MGVTRTLEIPPRGHTLAGSLREIEDEGGVAVRVELAPQTPFAGDAEFDDDDLSDWTQTNGAQADAINADTTEKSHLHIELNATTSDWDNATRNAPYVHQVLSGDFDVYARVKWGDVRDFHQVSLIAQSTSDADDWIAVKHACVDASTPNLSFVFITTVNGTSGVTLSALANTYAVAPLFLRMKRSGNDFSAYHSRDGKTWTQIGSTTTRSDFSADANVGFSVGTGGGNTANAARGACDFLRSWPPYVTTSPVGSIVIDSGVNGTTWDMSTFDALVNEYVEDAGYRATVGRGTLKFKYGAGDTNPPSLNASYLTEAQMQSESDPTGRYFKLEVQYISANGYEQASFNGAKIDGTISMVVDGDIDGYTPEEALKLILAAAVAKSSGGKASGASAPVFRDAADTKNRISATVDADGNRTAVTLDASGGSDIDSYTPTEAFRLTLSALAGKSSGGQASGASSPVIRAADDSKDRISATVDADGNRTAVTLVAT